jgi:DNA-binding XRE family transcriptional regulator
LKGQKPRPPGYPDRPETLGDHLRKRRLDLGISQRELAERIGVSKWCVENWERNRVQPSRTLARELRGFLGIEVPAHPTPLAGRLMELRRSRNLTHAQVAGLLGVHRRTVIRWEMGKANPTPSLLNRVEMILGLTRSGQ